MRFITVAMLWEAKPILAELKLNRDKNYQRLQVFRNEDTTLLVTGVGEIGACSALTEFLMKEKVGDSDLLFNIGTAGIVGLDEISEVYRVNAIHEDFTGRNFYPDLLGKSTLPEMSLRTLGKVWSGEDITDINQEFGGQAEVCGQCLVDMEAAAIYQVGSRCFSPDRMCFIKVVSDSGDDAKTLTPKDVEEKMEAALPKILGEMEYVEKKVGAKYLPGEDTSGVSSDVDCEPLGSLISNEKDRGLEELTLALKCSVTMESELKDLLHYLELTGQTGLFDEYFEEGFLPAKSKRDGKKILDQVKLKSIGL